jgi:Cu+-exporting ATPase
MASQGIVSSLDDGRVTFADRISTKDPVCRADVDPQDRDTRRLERGGKTYFFCSEECKQSFQAHPENYAP